MKGRPSALAQAVRRRAEKLENRPRARRLLTKLSERLETAYKRSNKNEGEQTTGPTSTHAQIVHARLRSIVPIAEPLVLITQAPRSGGSLLL